VDTIAEIAREEAVRTAASLRGVLPADLLPLFDASFIRSHLLYDEFVYRLVLEVTREIGLEDITREPGTPEEIARRAQLAPEAALVPLDWMLRTLAARGLLDESSARRYAGRGVWPRLDPAVMREEQMRHDASWAPAYVLAETVAREYPAFLRGEATGEDVLFAPRRLRLWIDYFSNDHGLYAVNNRVGAIALERWLPRAGAIVLELGGGLASGTLAVIEHLERRGRLDAIAEYRFTEYVTAFLRRSEQTLRGRDPRLAGLTFGALDMNRSFAEQGVAPGSVSVIFAVNTLHVARDLEFTLGEVIRALEPAGRLVISECVLPGPRQPIYTEFVFNLTETFRSPRFHPIYRPGGGFLTPEQWKAAMEAAGLVDVRFLPDMARVRERVPEFLLAAIGATRP